LTASFVYEFRLNMNIMFITTSIFKYFMDVKVKYVQINNGGDILPQLTFLLTKLVSLFLCL